MAEYIARISYGKDSLKMLEVIKSRGLPLDRITTTDVWATDTVSARLPPMEAFVERMDQKIWDMYRIQVEHLCAMNKDGTKKTYEQMFYHVPVRKSGGYRQGTILGFPDLWNPWCQAALKRNAKPQSARNDYRIPSKHRVQLVSEAQTLWGGEIKGFPLATGVTWCQKLKSRAKNPRIPGTDITMVPQAQDRLCQDPFSVERRMRRRNRNIIEYLGIAADEPNRHGQLNEKKRAPLVEFDIDEGLCGLYCQYNDMLAPTYETSCRDGCWFCHNQGVDQLRNLWRNYPDLWALLMKWDKDSPVTFKADGHTVHDFDRRFQMEVERKIPMNRTFRWEMLDKPPKFVAYEGDQMSLSLF